MSDDEELVMLAAIRYALGRRTYIVQSVTRRIAENLPRMSIETIRLLAREIHGAPDWGDAPDAARWRGLLALLDGCNDPGRERG